MSQSKIKLLKLNESKDGEVIRLQSQLCVGKDSADFILRNGVLECWSKGEFGFQFYPIDIPYEIVDNPEDMKEQKL